MSKYGYGVLIDTQGWHDCSPGPDGGHDDEGHGARGHQHGLHQPCHTGGYPRRCSCSTGYYNTLNQMFYLEYSMLKYLTMSYYYVYKIKVNWT